MIRAFSIAALCMLVSTVAHANPVEQVLHNNACEAVTVYWVAAGCAGIEDDVWVLPEKARDRFATSAKRMMTTLGACTSDATVGATLIRLVGVTSTATSD